MNKQKITSEYLPLILTTKVYDVAIETPLEKALQLSHKLGNHIYFKREDLQPVFSFKIRGAYNKIAHLSVKQKQNGIITASAGNHAQGVALSAAKLGIKAFIIMPITTPNVKIEAVKRFGGLWVDLILQGESFSDSYKYALELQQQKNLTFIHPFNDKYVIAGQGTVAMEATKQFAQIAHKQNSNVSADISAIFVAIGGGGLISGIACYIKAIMPQVKIIGVQTIDSNAMQQSVQADTAIVLKEVGLFSDGTAVKQVGDETLKITKYLVDEIITINTDEVCAAIKDIFEDTRSIVEPAGALAVAGLKKYVEKNACREEHLIAINCGANINFDRLSFVAERAQIGEAKEALFAISIPEQAGSLKRFCTLLGTHHITEFNYRYANNKQAHIFVGIKVENQADIQDLETMFKQQPFDTINLTHDELAGLHIRHMVGGRATATNERLIRIEFPERPGALMNFLLNMQPQWNISLFHYRNHGADYARVLIGIQVEDEELQNLKTSLDNLGYPYVDESNHKAYQMFLQD